MNTFEWIRKSTAHNHDADETLNHLHSNSHFTYLEYSFNFEHPFTCVVSGPTMSGKSVFVKNLIDIAHKKIKPSPDRVHYHYGTWQPLFETMPTVSFFEGLPSLETFSSSSSSSSSCESSSSTLVIIDDLMSDVNGEISDFFTKGAHHKNLSVIYICQNLFHNNRVQRTININSQYLILFKNPRDILQVQFLGRSILGRNSSEFESIYLHATSRAHGYLLVNLRQNTPDEFRFLTYVLHDHPKNSLNYKHCDVYVLDRFLENYK